MTIGLAAVGLIGAHGRIAGGSGALTVDVLVSAIPSGELAVSPADSVVDAKGLRPGQSARGQVTVRNQTGVALSLVPRTTTSLPSELHMRVGEADSFVVGSGDGMTLDVEVSLASEGDALLGQVVDVGLRFDVEKATA